MSATTPDGTPQRRACEYISGKAAPSQIPFTRMKHHRTEGDARAAGAQAPEKHALSRKNPDSNKEAGEKMRNQRSPVMHLWQEPYRLPTVKTFKITVSLPLDTPVSIIRSGWRGIPGIFKKKTGRFFPVRNPLYFSSVMPLRTCPKSRITCGSGQFFTVTGRPLNCTVFSELKQPVLKNNDLYR